MDIISYSRTRICYDWNGNVSKECDGIGVEGQSCSAGPCTTGQTVVKDTIKGTSIIDHAKIKFKERTNLT